MYEYFTDITIFSIFRIDLQGGLKAAINADVIQSLTVILVTLAVIIQGAIDAGGPATVFNRNLDNGE